MVTVFRNAYGIIFIDYLKDGRTITGPYYATLLDCLNDEMKVKRPHLQGEKILFHRDNTPAHRSLIAMGKIHELRYELLPRLAYSPGLAPCGFHLFPNLKNGSAESGPMTILKSSML